MSKDFTTLIVVLDDIMNRLYRAIDEVEGKLPDDLAVHNKGSLGGFTDYPITSPLRDLSGDIDRMLDNLRAGQGNCR